MHKDETQSTLKGDVDGDTEVIIVPNDNIYPSTVAVCETVETVGRPTLQLALRGGHNTVALAVCETVETVGRPTLQLALRGSGHNTLALPRPVTFEDNIGDVNSMLDYTIRYYGDRSSNGFNEDFLNRWFELPALGGNSIMVRELAPGNTPTETIWLRHKVLSL